MNGVVTHQDYKESGLKITEFEVLNDNSSLLQQIKTMLPNFSEEELKQNTYNLYYKSYNIWNLEC